MLPVLWRARFANSEAESPLRPHIVTISVGMLSEAAPQPMPVEAVRLGWMDNLLNHTEVHALVEARDSERIRQCREKAVLLTMQLAEVIEFEDSVVPSAESLRARRLRYAMETYLHILDSHDRSRGVRATFFLESRRESISSSIQKWERMGFETKLSFDGAAQGVREILFGLRAQLAEVNAAISAELQWSAPQAI